MRRLEEKDGDSNDGKYNEGLAQRPAHHAAARSAGATLGAPRTLGAEGGTPDLSGAARALRCRFAQRPDKK